ncbi:MAG: Fe-S cluster assembly ATPase SufC [Treponemataceae bacterium]|nr:Fe-S cluster assembly ATPase SufC [Treponemataceae bacterium]
MADQLLKVEGLHVSVEEKEILKGLNIEVNKGETHVIMGPNGAGKSTFGNALMGNPNYTVTAGKVTFNGKNLLEESVDKRAKDGLFMSFQNPIEIPGLSVSDFIRSAVENITGQRARLLTYKKELAKAMEILQMDPEYAKRDLNVGFSGGEKKKAEILQLLMLKPSLAILDETDSGLDVDAVRTVSKGIEEYQKDKNGSLIIITHNMGILSSLHADVVHVLVDGKIVKTGDASLLTYINEKGFAEFEKEENNER